MDVKEAKRLEVIQRNLVKKFLAAEQEEQRERAKKLEEISNVKQLPVLKPTKKIHEEPLTVQKAKQLEQLQAKLQNQFGVIHATEREEQREREKRYDVITKAIKEKKEKDELVKQRTKELVKQEKYNQLAKRMFRPRVSSTPNRIDYIRSTYDDEGENMEVVADKSIKELMDTKVVNLGAIGTRYLPRASDPQFGIYFDEGEERLKVGSEPIAFDYDDIIINEKYYKGTEGLWKLLTRKGLINPDEYTSNDWQLYKDILLATNSLYQKNDPTTRRPKSSQGQKWKKMIKPIWDDIVKPPPLVASPAATPVTAEPTPTPSTSEPEKQAIDDLEDDTFVGSGLRLYHNGPVEYKYIKNLNELINRLNFIHAEEVAGNNSFHNEKLSVVKFIYDRMEELINKPNGLKYVVRCLSALPERAIEGSGLLNDIINKLPIELHAPRNWNFDTYNFCGPGTKLAERLGRGDKGVNPLDEACKQHDIWYRDHRNAEDRWVADKTLQKAAWDRVKSSDADLNERAVALATTGTMWLKQKLGLGLGTSACVYPCKKKIGYI